MRGPASSRADVRAGDDREYVYTIGGLSFPQVDQHAERVFLWKNIALKQCQMNVKDDGVEFRCGWK